MAKLKKQDLVMQAAYRKCHAKQFGDLHERMKFVMQEMQKSPDLIPHELWHAIYDLETEVMFYPPQRPPFGKRVMPINKYGLR